MQRTYLRRMQQSLEDFLRGAAIERRDSPRFACLQAKPVNAFEFGGCSRLDQDVPERDLGDVASAIQESN